MKKWFVLWLVASALALVPTAAAAEDGQGDSQGNHFGPYSSASTDSGTCGNDWANDTYKRQFLVHQTGPTTWQVTEKYIEGQFVTIADVSPGACETSSPHGATVTAGNTGNFHGFLSGTVTGGTLNPAGCDVAADCASSTTGFIVAVFGPAAQYSCLSGVGTCSFYFAYHANGDQDLAFHNWVNASDDLGGNRGDIATS